MAFTDVLERRLQEISQHTLFSEVQRCLEDITEQSTAEYVVTCKQLQKAAQALDYNMIGDPRVES